MLIDKEEVFLLFDRRYNGIISYYGENIEPTQTEYVYSVGKKLGVKVAKHKYLRQYYNEWKSLRWGDK